MPRRPLHVLTLDSAVICVGSLLLVVRSFAWHDEISLPFNENYHLEVLICEGLLFLARSPDSNSFDRITARTTPGVRMLIHDAAGRAKGVPWVFGWAHFYARNTVLLPLWLVPLLAAILPVRWWRRRRSRSRTRGFPVVEATAEQT